MIKIALIALALAAYVHADHHHHGVEKHLPTTDFVSMYPAYKVTSKRVRRYGRAFLKALLVACGPNWKYDNESENALPYCLYRCSLQEIRNISCPTVLDH